jgi:hypothetical protein
MHFVFLLYFRRSQPLVERGSLSPGRRASPSLVLAHGTMAAGERLDQLEDPFRL